MLAPPFAILHAICWHQQVFMIDDAGGIWRVWAAPDGITIEKLVLHLGHEYNAPVGLLKAMREAARC